MTNKNKKNVFQMFFVSYVLISAVPLLIMSGIFYYLNVIDYKKEVSTSNISQLTQVKYQIDSSLKVLKDITYNISTNSKMTFVLTKDGLFQGEDIVSQLSTYQENCPIVDKILFYKRGDMNIYSSEGQYNFDVFEEQTKKDISWIHTSFFKDLNTISAPRTTRIQAADGSLLDGNSTLMLMHPVPYLNTLPQATVSYMIKESNILSVLKNLLGDFKGYTYVFDNNSNVLASECTSMLKSNLDAVEKQLRLLKGTGVFTMKIADVDFTVMRIVSEETGWSYIVAMPPSHFFARVSIMRNIVLAIIIVLILAGIGSAIFMSINNYKPIKTLFTFIKNQYPQSTNIEGYNELEFIRYNIESTFERNKELTVQVDAQRPLVKDQCLLKILRGKIQDIYELDYLLKCSNVNLKGIVYFSIVISTRPTEFSKGNIEKILQLVENLYFIHGVGYGVEMIQEESIAMLLSIEKNNDNKKAIQSDMAQNIVLLIDEKLGLRPVIGIGNVCIDILQLNTSFLEASAALYDNRENCSSNIYFFNEIERMQEKVIWYPIMELALFLQSLKHGDKIVALDTLNVMTGKLSQGTSSYLMLRCVCFEIVNSIIKTINQMNIECFNKDIRNLAEFANLDEFKSRLTVFSIKFCEYIYEFKESRNNELKNAIIQFVNDHFRENTLCLEVIAGKFEISTTYLSRFFKNETGVNFIEYVTSLRMDFIKNQLRSTDKPIKDIIKETGYFDAASFVRKFKVMEGITPSQYREMRLLE